MLGKQGSEQQQSGDGINQGEPFFAELTGLVKELREQKEAENEERRNETEQSQQSSSSGRFSKFFSFLKNHDTAIASVVAIVGVLITAITLAITTLESRTQQAVEAKARRDAIALEQIGNLTEPNKRITAAYALVFALGKDAVPQLVAEIEQAVRRIIVEENTDIESEEIYIDALWSALSQEKEIGLATIARLLERNRALWRADPKLELRDSELFERLFALTTELIYFALPNWGDDAQMVINDTLISDQSVQGSSVETKFLPFTTFLQDAFKVLAEIPQDQASILLEVFGVHGVDLGGAILPEADLSQIYLRNANLIEANLTKASLSGSNLTNAYLFGAYLSEADLSHANLSQADLSRALLVRADLREANLSSAVLFGAILWGADLTGAELRGAQLPYTGLREANLSSAVLTSTVLVNADLTGADLSGVVWGNTTCPDGTNSDDNNGTCENNLVPVP